MEESMTYQAAVQKGEAIGIEKGRKEGLERGKQEGLERGKQEGLGEGQLIEAQEFVLRLGRKRLGEPDLRTIDILRGLKDRERLEEIGERLLDATNWSQTLGPLASGGGPRF